MDAKNILQPILADAQSEAEARALDEQLRVAEARGRALLEQREREKQPVPVLEWSI